MITESIRFTTVRDMLDCPATSFAFWSNEFMIFPDEDLTIKSYDENKVTFMLDPMCLATVSLDDTLETLEAKFSAALSVSVAQIKQKHNL